jgi:hypothetical protein
MLVLKKWYEERYGKTGKKIILTIQPSRRDQLELFGQPEEYIQVEFLEFASS